ncbi:hypothetical protein [Thermaurantiacus sp.]
MMARPRAITWLAAAIIALNGIGVLGNLWALASRDPAFLPWQWGLFLLLKLGGVAAGLLILNLRTSGLWLFGLVMAMGLLVGLLGPGDPSAGQTLGAGVAFALVGLWVAAIVWPHIGAFRGWPARRERVG